MGTNNINRDRRFFFSQYGVLRLKFKYFLFLLQRLVLYLEYFILKLINLYLQFSICCSSLIIALGFRSGCFITLFFMASISQMIVMMIDSYFT